MLLFGNGDLNTTAGGFCLERAAATIFRRTHAAAGRVTIKGFGTQDACVYASAGGMQIEGCRITAVEFNRSAGIIDRARSAADNILQIDAARGVLDGNGCGRCILDFDTATAVSNIQGAIYSTKNVDATAGVSSIQISTYVAVDGDATARVFDIDCSCNTRGTSNRTAYVLQTCI